MGSGYVIVRRSGEVVPVEGATTPELFHVKQSLPAGGDVVAQGLAWAVADELARRA